MKETDIRRRIRWCLMPYGKWTCADGREVLFNRRYRLILQRVNGKVSDADPGEWVSYIATDYFYGDGTPDKASAAIRAYEEFTGKRWDWVVAKTRMPGIDVRLTESHPGPRAVEGAADWLVRP